MTKFYVAFSIHGTNGFTVVTREAESVEALGADFKVVQSRRGTYSPADGTKVVWDKLNKSDGRPHVNKAWVARRMNELVKAGWTKTQDLGQR